MLNDVIIIVIIEVQMILLHHLEVMMVSSTISQSVHKYSKYQNRFDLILTFTIQFSSVDRRPQNNV